MKFVTLISRGGNYMLATHNVAWLREGENGQTQIGIVGGDSLLVTGSMAETAAAILAAGETSG
jgi:hydrogenase maturation factor